MSELISRPAAGQAPGGQWPVDPGATTEAHEQGPRGLASWRRVALWGALGVVLLVGIVLAVSIDPFADAAGSCGGGPGGTRP